MEMHGRAKLPLPPILSLFRFSVLALTTDGDACFVNNRSTPALAAVGGKDVLRRWW